VQIVVKDAYHFFLSLVPSLYRRRFLKSDWDLFRASLYLGLTLGRFWIRAAQGVSTQKYALHSKQHLHFIVLDCHLIDRFKAQALDYSSFRLLPWPTATTFN
jgi:hypothetical protein